MYVYVIIEKNSSNERYKRLLFFLNSQLNRASVTIWYVLRTIKQKLASKD